MIVRLKRGVYRESKQDVKNALLCNVGEEKPLLN